MKTTAQTLALVLISLTLATYSVSTFADEKSVSEEAEQRTNDAAANRKKAMETAKKYGVSQEQLNQMIGQGVGGIAQGQMDQINNNPFFNKSDEELRALGLSEEKIQDIRKGQAGSAELGKNINAVGTLSQEALSNPDSARVKKLQKSDFKRQVASEREEEKLGVKDANEARKSNQKLEVQKTQSNQ